MDYPEWCACHCSRHVNAERDHCTALPIRKWWVDIWTANRNERPQRSTEGLYHGNPIESGQSRCRSYGHAVLRQPDPRFMAQNHLQTCTRRPYCANRLGLVWGWYLKLQAQLARLKPMANVDAHSGALLCQYGYMVQNYYTVLFGVS